MFQSDLVALRVDLNAPNAELRKNGEFASAVTYFFANGKSVLIGYSAQGRRNFMRSIVGQSMDGADTNISDLRKSFLKNSSHPPSI